MQKKKRNKLECPSIQGGKAAPQGGGEGGGGGGGCGGGSCNLTRNKALQKRETPSMLVGPWCFPVCPRHLRLKRGGGARSPSGHISRKEGGGSSRWDKRGRN